MQHILHKNQSAKSDHYDYQTKLVFLNIDEYIICLYSIYKLLVIKRMHLVRKILVMQYQSSLN